MKVLIAMLAVTFALLQWRLWVGDGGVREISHYKSEIRTLNETLELQQDTNKALRAEVNDLEQGVGEIEERARGELGMIGNGETFYQFVGEKVDIGSSDNLAVIESGDAATGGETPTKKIQ